MSLPAIFIHAYDVELANFVSATWGAVANVVTPWIRSLAVMMIAGYGYALQQGKIQAPVPEAMRIFASIAIVTMGATQWEWFLYINDAISHGDESFIKAITGGANASTGLDAFFDRGMDTSFAILSKAGTFDFALYFLGGTVFVGTIVQTGVAVFAILEAKIMSALLLAFGSVFIVFALFRTSRPIFMNWIQSLLGFLFTKVLVFGVLAISLRVYNHLVPEGELFSAQPITKEAIQGGVLPLILLMFVVYKLLWRVSGISARLFQGMAADTGAWGGIASIAKGMKAAATGEERGVRGRLQRRKQNKMAAARHQDLINAMKGGK